ncbi:MAG TPA: hypothetical protein VHK90_05595 [Thermoanaerobaculia bacterium]|nr:hypothetical protein [Thermoanaerobaculia bacterium]
MNPTLTLVCGWTIVLLVGAFGVVILVWILLGKIDLSHILSEPGSDKASLSRLQFLIFTVVISLSLFLVIAGKNPAAFPQEIPAGIFALLGISGGTYVIAKGVETKRDVEVAKAKAEVAIAETSARVEMARMQK